MSKELVTFEELRVFKNEDLGARIEKHTGQIGSVYHPKAAAMEALKIAEGNVKSVKGIIDYETRCLGYIPRPDGGQLKITEAALKAYVDQHEDTVKAIKEEAEATKHLDDCRALATAHADVKDLLKLLQSVRYNEWYSDPTVQAQDGVPGL